MLQEDLNRLYKWAEVDNMKLNGKKFEHLHYGKQHKSNCYFTEESKIIKGKEVVNDLGVMISNKLQSSYQWSDQKSNSACGLDHENVQIQR